MYKKYIQVFMDWFLKFNYCLKSWEYKLQDNLHSSSLCPMSGQLNITDVIKQNRINDFILFIKMFLVCEQWYNDTHIKKEEELTGNVNSLSPVRHLYLNLFCNCVGEITMVLLMLNITLKRKHLFYVPSINKFSRKSIKTQFRSLG